MESDSLELFVSDSVGELTNVPSVNSAADDGALRQRWLVWYERAHEDIVSLHSHQASWDELVAVVRRNPAIPEPNHILDFIADLYAPTIALGIRRQADRRSDVENLRRLIDDIANHPETLTREWYVAKYSEEMQSVGHTTFDRFAGVGQDATSEAVIRKDCEELDLAVSTVRKYVNKVCPCCQRLCKGSLSKVLRPPRGACCFGTAADSLLPLGRWIGTHVCHPYKAVQLHAAAHRAMGPERSNTPPSSREFANVGRGRRRTTGDAVWSDADSGDGRRFVGTCGSAQG